MSSYFTRRRFLENHRDLPPGQMVGLIGSHRRIVWPPMCPACGGPASSHINVARIFGRRSQHGGFAAYRFIVRMTIPFCQSCVSRHQQQLQTVPSAIGSFFRTPGVLSFIGAVAVAVILWWVFVQDAEGVSRDARLYAISGIIALVGLGIFITAREARFLRVPPLTEVTSACDFSDNLGFPFGRRRFYAIRNRAFADAFVRANHDRLWTDAIRKRDAWVSGVAGLVLIIAALIAWLVRG
jgi:hypothetical protein